jgi:hypothetical protein
MRTHPRAEACQRAHIELGSLLADWRKKHSLTTTEFFKLLVEEMQTTLKFCLRSERHPHDSSLPADVE